MAVSESFRTYVLDQLEGTGELFSRRMFGGVGIYCNDLFFAVIDNDTLFFKVDETTREDYVREGMPPFQPIPGKPPMQGYFQVPVSVLEDRDQLAHWASKAVGVASRAKKR